MDLMSVLFVALIIDVMSLQSLGFTIPGMITEYQVDEATVSLPPFTALTGTVIRSIVWGVVPDVYGRQASILLSAVMFVRTSICGGMPSFAWNIAMCFHDGSGCGRHASHDLCAPCRNDAERAPRYGAGTVRRLGAVGGYFAASGFSALLQPDFGWQILWMLELPYRPLTGDASRLHSEIRQFLLARGRHRGSATGDGTLRLRRREELQRPSMPRWIAVPRRADWPRLFGELFALSFRRNLLSD